VFVSHVHFTLLYSDFHILWDEVKNVCIQSVARDYIICDIFPLLFFLLVFSYNDGQVGSENLASANVIYYYNCCPNADISHKFDH
jgi:hypothetical protein